MRSYRYRKDSTMYPAPSIKAGFSTMEIYPFLSEFPEPLDFGPRDKKAYLTQTEDFIFLAGILSGDYGKYITYFLSEDNVPLFLRERDGEFFHPFYDVPVTADKSLKEKAKIGRNTVYKAFRDKFFFIRREMYRLLEQYHEKGIIEDSGEIFKVSGNIIRGVGASAENLLKIEKRIKVPVEINNDPFLHRWKEQEFVRFDDNAACPQESIICPYHGIIKPYYASMTSSGIRGKLTGYALCPKCFGAIKTTTLLLMFR